MLDRRTRRAWISAPEDGLSVRAQCELLDLSRSGLYYKPHPESAENLGIMRLIDEIYTEYPFYGSRRIKVTLETAHAISICRERVQRLMRLMGIQAIYPKPKTSQRHPGHKVFPYLLRDVPIVRRDQVWSTDITYVGLATGFVYLIAVIDWFTRYVLAWRLSNSLDGEYCIAAVEDALNHSGAVPEVFNTDQGSQFTSPKFTGLVLSTGAQMSMDGRGRALDNVFVERLWRSYKYEEVYLREYQGVADVHAGCERYFSFFNHKRPHQSLGDQTPASLYFGHVGFPALVTA